MKLNAQKVYKRHYQFTDCIHLATKNTSLVIGIEDTAYQIYRGAKISNPESLLRNGDAPLGEELYPIYSAFGADDNHGALRVTHANGKLGTELLYASHTTENSLTTITLKDLYQKLTVRVFYQTYTETDVIEQWVEIEHQQSGEVTIHQAPSCDNTMTTGNDYYLSSFQGLWERESSLQEERLTHGSKVLDNRYGTWSSFGYNPSFMLSIAQPATEQTGDVLAGALAWSGAWKISFDLNFGLLNHDTRNREYLQIRAGANDFAAEYTLGANSIYQTPKFISTFSADGKGQASRNLHRWSREHKLRDGDKLRPILLNSWEGAYFDFDEPLLLNMMDNLKEMGGEMFVLDDGWFGNGEHARNGANAGLGDWQINTEKLPHPEGLNYLAKEAQNRGLEFGIWVEPEMVNPQSQLFKDHPDWVIFESEREVLLYRNQLVLDLSNPEVQEFVYQSVANTLSNNPLISYVKWDCNRSFMNIGSQYLAADKQTHLWKDYVDGLYSVYQRLEKDFPDTMIQVCASGGGRIDYGALQYHHEFWTSDNTDALQRIFIQWGVNHIYPAIATAAHVSACPNHQTGRTLPLKFRFDVAMSGRMGLELNPKDMASEELGFVKQAVDNYKTIRPIVQFGELYRLRSPYKEDTAALMYTYENDAVIFVYKIAHHLGQSIPMLKLQGLDTEAKYHLTEINSSEKSHSTMLDETHSGDQLMHRGIPLALHEEYASATFLLKHIAN